ncbi:regulatory protein RecX [Pseudobacteroides cellulosolvens]|uniref:Regulatory protein RecX n=1 Tax=Pseudobacteroides cellulosolvens ATCC 35603 = DSM 2933 TaxID=398512 RepID=A0A0L6JKI6_9FIRM|nr:regulatory protein RecX [Pseudobacteroides cellulosolvens]KNY26265.1 Regulatory protein recX [Pseudobacteroides cellulosolvens ATCC 35603 = DSM 2933]
MIITDVKKNKDNVVLNIDGKYSLVISEEEYLRSNLYEKTEITKEEFDYINHQINYRNAKSVAIRFVSLKLRSEKEILNRLNDEGFDEDTVLKAIEEMKAMGYINDLLYASKFIHDRCKLKPKSLKMLKFELKNKGISDSIICEVLDKMDIDESAVAEGLVRKKFGKYDLNDDKIVKKVYYFLRHRGYSSSVIESVLKNFQESK